MTQKTKEQESGETAHRAEASAATPESLRSSPDIYSGGRREPVPTSRTLISVHVGTDAIK